MGNLAARRAAPANSNEVQLPDGCFETRCPPSPHVWWDGSKVGRWEAGEWVDTTPMPTQDAPKPENARKNKSQMLQMLQSPTPGKSSGGHA